MPLDELENHDAKIGLPAGMGARTSSAVNTRLAVGLLVYIFLGGGYEMRTLVAMALRLGFWVVLARLARQELKTSDNLKRSVL